MHDPSPLSPAELLSALADDQLGADPATLDRLLVAWADDPALAQAWRDHHWLGEALRSGAQGLPPASIGFAAAVMQQVALEPPALPVAVPASRTPPAANDALFRWKLVAGVASVSAAVAVLWQLTAAVPGLAPAAGPLAQGAMPLPAEPPRVTAVVTERGVLLRDPELDALLAAHRRQGGVSALQMPAGFLRDATYEAATR